MIEQAAKRVDQLVVYVNWSSRRDTVPGELRATWLTELHPNVEIRGVWHQLGTDFDDEELWSKWMALFRDHWPYDDGPHAVFSSDPYVSGLAERFDAEAITIDAERNAVPISATQIRERPHDHLDMVAEPVRAWIESNWIY